MSERFEPMNIDFQKMYLEIEENRWWFRARREVIRELIGKEGDRDIKILDVGCSGGALLAALASWGYNKYNLFGIDNCTIAIKRGVSRGLRNVTTMDAMECNFAAEMFDVVVASDVLEHIEDDSGAIGAWRRVLKPDGRLICFVPAYKFLFGPHDIVNGHYRRYRRSALCKKVEECGMKVKESGYWNSLLFPCMAGYRLLSKHNRPNVGGDGDWGGYVVKMDKLLYRVLSAERQLSRYLKMPFGLSAYCVAVR